MKKLEAKTE